MELKNNGQLLKILERLCELLERSKESDWSPLTPSEVRSNLQCQMDLISQGAAIDKDKLIIEFLPTSTLQEISMSNDWSDEFLIIAAKFDNLIKNIKTTKTENKADM